jgi:hypothetical protein
MGRIDHVMVGVRDLDAAACMMLERFGLEAQPGGSHPGAGTANLIVDVGNDQFLELLAVVDPASQHPVPARFRELVRDGDRLVTFAVAPDDFEGTAARLGEPIFSVARHADDGREVQFRVTGAVGLVSEEVLPHFVTTDAGKEWRCGWRPARHRVEPTGIAWIEYVGDRARVAARLADDGLPVRIVAGDRAGIRALAIATASGPAVELRF